MRTTLPKVNPISRMKHSSRRSFAKTTGIAIGGIISGVPSHLLSGEAITRSTQAASTTTVLQMVSQYASDATLTGAGVASHQTGKPSPLTKIIAKVSDPAAFQKVLERAASDRIAVSGNTFSLESGGAFYSVTNLSPEDFASELGSLQRGNGNFFCYESLTATTPSASSPNSTYTIAPLPHASLHSANAANGFASWFDTLIAAKTRDFTISSEGNKCGDMLCASLPTADTARQTVDDVIERIAYAAEVLEPETLRSIIASPFVDGSFRSAAGRSSANISQNYERLRRRLGGHSESSVWLALAVGNVNDDGAIHRALTSTNALYADSTRSALAGALEILQSGSLANLGVADRSGEEHNTNTTGPAWQASLLASAGDLDGDGVPSLVEYALGTDPLDPASLPEPSLSTETEGGRRYLSLTYQKNTALTDVTYVAQTSSDLSPGEWSTNGVEDREISKSGGIERRRARVAMTGRQQYLRVLISAK